MANLLIDAISFQVIGELKGDPGHLLLIGDDGGWYDFDIVQVTIEPIELGDSWAVDIADHSVIPFQATVHHLMA
jgi:hypothetical protein